MRYLNVFPVLFLLCLSCAEDEVPFDEIIDVDVLQDSAHIDTSGTGQRPVLIPVAVSMSAGANSESKMVEMFSTAGFFLDFANPRPATGDTVMVDLRSKIRGDSICTDTLTFVADTIPGFFLIHAQTGGEEPFIARDTLVLIDLRWN